MPARCTLHVLGAYGVSPGPAVAAELPGSQGLGAGVRGVSLGPVLMPLPPPPPAPGELATGRVTPAPCARRLPSRQHFLRAGHEHEHHGGHGASRSKTDTEVNIAQIPPYGTPVGVQFKVKLHGPNNANFCRILQFSSHAQYCQLQNIPTSI